MNQKQNVGVPIAGPSFSMVMCLCGLTFQGESSAAQSDHSAHAETCEAVQRWKDNPAAYFVELLKSLDDDRVILLCFEAHAPDGKVWSIQRDGVWLGPFAVVQVCAQMQTVYRGQDAAQPKAYLQAIEPVDLELFEGVAVIKAALR